MFGELLIACGLVLIIEGLLPATMPARWKEMIRQFAEMPDRTIRIGGIVMLLAGAVIFHLAR